MDVVERLTLEMAQADTVLACEHRHRYEFAAQLCAGRRVLDLCCGSGYGSAIVASHAREVVGVDNHAATIQHADATVGRHVKGVRFEHDDAVGYLEREIAEQFDVIVCFEGLEHLDEFDRGIALLREHAENGVQIIASVPNEKLFEEQNPYHRTKFGYEEAAAAFAGFPATVMLPQFLAEGSLICPPGAVGAEVAVLLDDRDEVEYANHFIFCVNFEPAVLERVHHGVIQVATAPVFNRWAEDLKHGLWALQSENARLARARIGREASAPRATSAAPARHHAGKPAPVSSTEVAEDPNSWEHRSRSAAEHLIPWIEQTVSLAGKTVLDYGCGNAAVSLMFAKRAGRLIGVDVDAALVDVGREALAARGLQNVELELHPADSILDAVAARRGEIDVFLCYAVLEHLTIEERLAVLRLARDVVKPDGAIIVCEAPNRLIYYDHHTAQMPFFHLLPEELAVEYYPRSERKDFTAALEAAALDGRGSAFRAMTRWGRGVSFHEFEVVFGDLARYVIASNYEPILFGERPVQPDEVMLARYLDWWRPDLAPVWSRYWLDVILSPHPIVKRPAFLRPWTADTRASHNVDWTGSETLHLTGADSTLWVTVPHPTGRLVIGTGPTPNELVLELRTDTMNAPLAAAVGPSWEHTYTSFNLPEPAQRVALSTSIDAEITFVGYDD